MPRGQGNEEDTRIKDGRDERREKREDILFTITE